MKLSCILAAAFFSIFLSASAQTTPTRWNITDDGGIIWNVKPGDVHEDNIEMTGLKVSDIVTYAVTNGQLSLDHFAIFPTFRTLPPNTRSHISTHFNNDTEPKILINGVEATNSVVTDIYHKGIMTINGSIGDNIRWQRKIFPSTDKPAIIEMISFTNNSIVTRGAGNAGDVTVELQGGEKSVRAGVTNGLDGPYVMSARILDSSKKTLKPGESATFVRVISARREADKGLAIDANAELSARENLIGSYLDKLQLVTPDKVLNTAFAFAKIRTTESIILTKGGLMHAPGGGRYYAAIWANDQGEYGPPFFPFEGDATGNGAASNAFRLFATYMNPEYKPIPSSIVAEGVTNWHGAGDRGDMAMIAYGASRYALASGDKSLAEKEWPLIQWCLEYCKRKIDTNGVVESDADELENRFPSGKANLNTSCLYYDALNSAVYLGKDLSAPQSQLDDYAKEAVAIRGAIEKYFGRNVDGFETYRYFDKSVPSVNKRALKKFAHYANAPDKLRAWICTPLTVGIFDRKDGTIAALFSTNLWSPDGLRTEEGDTVFWDRSTLYALRGVFAAGETEKALDYLHYYSARRLLGEHVPYPVEAYPEGNQSHLAAESALYCRIYTEGLFGIRPTGLRSFDCTPRLPKEWPTMALKHVRAFGNDFNLVVSRAGDKLNVEIFKNDALFKSYEIADGGTASVEL
jgi:hypothetical protein